MYIYIYIYCNTYASNTYIRESLHPCKTLRAGNTYSTYPANKL